MDPADNTPWPLLTRHFSGATSPEDAAALQQWIEGEASRVEFVAALRAAWEVTGALPERHSAPVGWQRVQRRLGHGAGHAAEAPLHMSVHTVAVPRRDRTKALVRIAAAMTIAVGLTATVWRPVAHLFGSAGHAPASPALALREAVTRRGQRATLRLADGTRVTLAAASTLRYPEAFATGTYGQRDVYLDGQAYFEVAHDRAHPFVVHARGAETRVLGTRFVVRAYTDDAAVQVAVNEGKVALRAARRLSPGGQTALSEDTGVFDNLAPAGAVILTRGMVGRLTSAGEATFAAGADIAPYLAWTEGRLVFHDTPLRDVLPELARRYDLDVRFAPGAEFLGTRRFTAAFADQPIGEVLAFLALSADVQVERHGRTVTVTPRRPR